MTKLISRPTSEERRLMRLLGFDTVEQLDLVLEGEPDEDALAHMCGDEDEYYDEDDEDGPDLWDPQQEFSWPSMLVEAGASKLKIDEVLRFIPAEKDRQTLEQLISKYEILRVRLSHLGPATVSTDEQKGRIAELQLRVFALEVRIAELEADKERLESAAVVLRTQAQQIEEWRAWAGTNIPIHERLLERHAHLREYCAELETTNKQA